MAPAAILDFEIRVFDSMRLLVMRSGWYIWSLTVLWSAVEKLLQCLFSIGNTLEVPKIGVLGDFRGENWNMYLSEPQKAPPCAKTRVLTYYSPKSVHNCDLWGWARKKTDIEDVNVGVCWGSLWLADSNEIWQSYRSPRRNEVCKISSASVTSFRKYRGLKLTTLGFTVYVPFNTLESRLASRLWFQ